MQRLAPYIFVAAYVAMSAGLSGPVTGFEMVWAFFTFGIMRWIHSDDEEPTP